MTKKILIDEAVVKQALVALENHPGNYKLSKAECVTYNAAEGALREALEVNNKGVNATEPVAWQAEHQSGEWVTRETPTLPSTGIFTGRIRALYTHPAPTQQDGTNGVVALQERLRQEPGDFQQASQESTVTFGEVERTMQALRTGTLVQKQVYDVMKDKPLYTSPPASKPLTDDELRNVLRNTNHMIRNAMHGPFWPELEQACRAIEAALGITGSKT